MPEVQYGNKTIAYTIQETPDLKSHYITVEKGIGVVLKGKPLPPEQADALVLKKARWVLDKLELVSEAASQPIVTGSRIPYLGKQYYTHVVYSDDVAGADITFNHSQFRIRVNPNDNIQESILEALEGFYRIKAIEKLSPRVKTLSERLKLPYTVLRFRKMEKRWGSCTASNTIILNYEAVKLPYSLIDYLIVHELTHTVEKTHSKRFWSELGKHLPNWKQLDERMEGYKL